MEMNKLYCISCKKEIESAKRFINIMKCERCEAEEEFSNVLGNVKNLKEKEGICI